MDLELRDRAVLITGGTDGLGLALATRLVEEGAMVSVCGRDEQRLALADERLGSRALCWRADVTDADQVDAFVDAALEKWGRLDGVVNNAGRVAGATVANSTDELWREDFDLKVVAAAHLIRRTLPALAAHQGAVVNILAISARAPSASSTPTAASRAAGLALTKALAHEVGPQGVRANAILIGLIESGQWVRRARAAGVALDAFYADLVSRSSIPLGRLGRAEEFADLASFLLSPRASYVTGVGIALDGGLSPVI